MDASTRVACADAPGETNEAPKFFAPGRKRCRPAVGAAHRPGASLPGASDPPHRRLPCRRPSRHHRADRSPMAGQCARANRRGREQARCRRQSRRRSGRQRGARRLHAVLRRGVEYREHDAVPQPALRLRARHRASRHHQSHPAGVGREPVVRGAKRRRVRRLCQSQSRQAQRRLAVGRHAALSVRRIAQDDGRHRRGARPMWARARW